MLNQAAQKFIFTLEQNYYGFGGGTCPLCPLLYGYTPGTGAASRKPLLASITLFKSTVYHTGRRAGGRGRTPVELRTVLDE